MRERDANMYFKDTVTLYKFGANVKPILVNEVVTAGGSLCAKSTSFEDGELVHKVIKGFDIDNTDPFPITGGYVQVGEVAKNIRRIPHRSVKRGYYTQNTRIDTLDFSPNGQLIRPRTASAANQMLLLCVHNCINNRFLTPEAAIAGVYGDLKSAAVSENIALAKTVFANKPTILYRNYIVGYVDNDKWSLFEADINLFEELSEVLDGMRGEII